MKRKTTRIICVILAGILLISLLYTGIAVIFGTRASATEGSTITVIFDPDGGVVNPTSKTVAINGTYGALPNPTRTGYTFAGWNTSPEGNSETIEATTINIMADAIDKLPSHRPTASRRHA